MQYNPQEIELKWQKIWEDEGIFTLGGSKIGRDGEREKFYALEQFPYPSGRLHMGHLRLYAIGDVISRYKWARGYDVLHPMGWDAFGLPAENAAIERGVHPGVWTHQNIDHMRAQLKRVGLSYDWSREVTTCDADYYRFEQKMFLRFLEEGLAYRKEATVNWDPVDNTVLANEQVIDGRGWRSGALVERRKLSQWFLRISDFAGDLLDGLEELKKPGRAGYSWPQRVISMQEKWIGRSEGAEISFEICDEGGAKTGGRVDVFTTRPDTIFGAAFCAISADHPLAAKLAEGNAEIAAFIDKCRKLGATEEAIEKAEKEGIATGLFVRHPFAEDADDAQGDKDARRLSATLPIYIANFVLMDYGTGAVFGCPAHDARDYEFARKYDLPIRTVVSPDGAQDFSVEGEAYTGAGKMINSAFLDGMDSAQAKREATGRLERAGAGKGRITYRLRDWGVSRQRYWGCPIPIIYCDKCGAVPVPEADLPVRLPDDVTFDGAGNPLDKHPGWKHVKCPSCGGDACRETDTFDTFFESSWYFLRYLSRKDEHHDNGYSAEDASRLMPVDIYMGGIEHAVLHLLYARFFTRALERVGYHDIKEPFAGLLTQGMVCHMTYKDASGAWVNPADIQAQGGALHHRKTGAEVAAIRVEKMSKSKHNVVDPVTMIERYGADTARLFMLSDSPPERDLEWSDSGVEGAWRYLSRVWKLAVTVAEAGTDGADDALTRLQHQTIFAVSKDIEGFHLNKAIARIRELTNAIEKSTADGARREATRAALQLLYPFIPHMAEELWQMLGAAETLAATPWPEADETLFQGQKVTIAVQVQGKLRGKFDADTDADKATLEELARNLPEIAPFLEGKEIRKTIIIPGRIVNFVTG